MNWHGSTDTAPLRDRYNAAGSGLVIKPEPSESMARIVGVLVIGFMLGLAVGGLL
jgi:hypothetical protein